MPAAVAQGPVLNGHAVPVPPPKVLPIGLDTILHLAEQQNGQIAVARAKLREAWAEKQLAQVAWLPTFQVGPGYFRHEGGVQNEDGTLQHSSAGAMFGGLSFYSRLDVRQAIFLQVQSERQIWQQKGELSQITSETLLDATTTYIDLLAARTAEVVYRNLLQYEEDILQQARDIAKTEPGTRFHLEAIEAETFGLRQMVTRLHDEGDAATRKLAYLLGLGCEVILMPVDGQLVAFEVVDPNTPCDELVGQAMAQGPGVRELERMLAVMLHGQAKAKGHARFAPLVEVGMIEGLFGAGPGSAMNWDNRWDLGLQMRWNLADLITGPRVECVTAARIDQVNLTYQDLRAKLSMGVRQARDASLSGRQEIYLAGEAVRHANEGYKLSRKRLSEHVPESSTTEVLEFIRGLQGVYAKYISAVSNYDKAQLRLLILTGCGGRVIQAGPGVPPPPGTGTENKR
jgi:outer membrane protein TolC